MDGTVEVLHGNNAVMFNPVDISQVHSMLPP